MSIVNNASPSQSVKISACLAHRVEASGNMLAHSQRQAPTPIFVGAPHAQCRGALPAHEHADFMVALLHFPSSEEVA
jgi:hypothetical protein